MEATPEEQKMMMKKKSDDLTKEDQPVMKMMKIKNRSDMKIEVADCSAKLEMQMMRRRLKQAELAAAAQQQEEERRRRRAMAAVEKSPEKVKLLCRSQSAENVKQRLTRTVKEHHTRFYIIRRCIQMLICWRDEY